jgi:thioredoxin reductase (NADPH)
MAVHSLKTDILIVGAGPAGLTAGLYVARAGKKALILEGRGPSRLAIPYTIENYPGFPSISSQELLGIFKRQAVSFGAEVARGRRRLHARRQPRPSRPEAGSRPARSSSATASRSQGADDPWRGQACRPGRQLLRHRRALPGRAVPPSAIRGGVEDVRALSAMGCKVLWVPGKSGGAAEGPEALALEAKGVVVERGAKVKEIRGAEKVEGIVVEAPSGTEVIPVSAVFIFREIPAGPLFEKAGLALDTRSASPSTASSGPISPGRRRRHVRRPAGHAPPAKGAAAMRPRPPEKVVPS